MKTNGHVFWGVRHGNDHNPVCTTAYMITAFHCLKCAKWLTTARSAYIFGGRRNSLSVVINNFFQLVLSSLESLYNLSGIGQATSHRIAEVHHSIGTVC